MVQWGIAGIKLSGSFLELRPGTFELKRHAKRLNQNKSAFRYGITNGYMIRDTIKYRKIYERIELVSVKKQKLPASIGRLSLSISGPRVLGNVP